MSDDDACAMCGQTFWAALRAGTAGSWAQQWAGPLSAKAVGETCSDACSDRFAALHRDENGNYRPAEPGTHIGG